MNLSGASGAAEDCGQDNVPGGKLAVLFDCDGVLVNSEEVIFAADYVLMQELGMRYTRREYAAISIGGHSFPMLLQRLNEDHMAIHGRRLPARFGNMMADRYGLLLHREMRPIEAITPFLKDLRSARVPFAVATNAGTNSTHWKLEHAGLSDYFNGHVYSREMVARPKPHPDVYLFAAAKLGHDAKDCFVVEDSVTGVTAGAAAGATVIGYTGGNHREADYGDDLRAAGAVYMASDMRDVAALIMKRIARGPAMG
ncbi:MAG: HAD family phosphatase [Alphaproteobacteria bacterium]|nr:HAD family phosphatase [Alphaproteobacteria bacterium]